MKRRLGCFLIFIVWLIIMSFPVMAFVLATQGQIEIGEQPSRQLRVFLVNEDNNEGVGIQWARRVREPAGCSQTSLNYLMWEGEADNARFCQCFDNDNNLTSSEVGRCSP